MKNQTTTRLSALLAKRPTGRHASALLAISLTAAAPSAQAVNIFWNNTGSTADTVANWWTTAAGTTTVTAFVNLTVSTGDTWNFSNVSPLNNTVGITTKNVQGIVFSNAANAYTLNTSGALSFGALGITNNSTTATQTFTGPVRMGGNSFLQTAGGTMQFNGSTFDLTLSGSSANRTLTIQGAGATNIVGAIGNGGTATAGSVTVTSTGATALSGNNTYDGTTTMNAVGGVLTLSGDNSGADGAVTITAGTVKLGHTSALGSTVLGTTVASGAVLDLNGQAIGAEAVSLTGSGISAAGALVNTSATTASLSGAVTLTGNTTIGAGNITLGNVGQSGTTSLTKTGAGTLTLNGTNSYTGGTVIQNGTLDITAGNSAGGAFTIEGSATTPVLKLSNVNALATTATLKGSAGASNTGTLDLAVAGAYTLGSYTGDNMKFTASSTSPTTLGFTNNSVVTSGSSGGRTLTNADANLTITFGGSLDISSNATGNLTIAGEGNTAVTGAVFNSGTGLRGLTKTGSGTLTLNGTNAYNGATQVSDGTLRINGSTSASSAVTVASGATLGGSGTVGGATTISSGGLLTAGTDASTIGTLSFSSTLTGSSGSTFSLKLNSSSLTSDLFTVTGAATLDGATLALIDLGSATLTNGQSFTLLTASSVSGTFLNLTNGAAIRVGTTDYTLNYLSNAVTLTAATSSIPEPSTYALLAGLGILGLVVYRRRS